MIDKLFVSLVIISWIVAGIGVLKIVDDCNRHCASPGWQYVGAHGCSCLERISGEHRMVFSAIYPIAVAVFVVGSLLYAHKKVWEDDDE